MQKIRKANAGDSPAIAAIYRYYVEETAISFELTAPREEEMARRIAAVQEKYPYLVLEEQGEVLGYAYASRYRDRAAYDRTAEISVYLRRDAQGQGRGKALLAALLQQLKEQGIMTVVSVITSGNQPSLNFFLSQGFQYAGTLENVGFKNGAWHGISQCTLPLGF